MVIQPSLFGVVFDSGATTLASSPVLAIMTWVDEHWLYRQSIVGDLSLITARLQSVKKNVQMSAYPLHFAGVSARKTTCRTAPRFFTTSYYKQFILECITTLYVHKATYRNTSCGRKLTFLLRQRK